MMEIDPEKKEAGVERWTMLRDLGVLQIKLIVDGLRDIDASNILIVIDSEPNAPTIMFAEAEKAAELTAISEAGCRR